MTALPDVHPPKARARRRRNSLTPWLFLAPGMLMFAVYVLIPIFQSVWVSFHEWDGLDRCIGSDWPII
ncbi:binding-protein-dependent transport system inner membrane component, partial [marine sediment metagenome]